MKKELICGILSLVLLASCSGKENSGDDVSETGSGTREAETCGLSDTETSPDEPENSDPADVTEDTAVSVDEDGTSYLNGVVATPEEIVEYYRQQATSHSLEMSKQAEEKEAAKTTTTAAVSPVPSVPSVSSGTAAVTTTTKPIGEIVPNLPVITTTATPTGTIVIEEEDYLFAKYVKTGNTALGITDIKVLSNERPGIMGLGAFKPGENLLINLWCNIDAANASMMYIVPAEADHKSSYSSSECLAVIDISESVLFGIDQLLLEVKLPAKIASGIYEFRFCSGAEEGYITFYLG